MEFLQHYNHVILTGKLLSVFLFILNCKICYELNTSKLLIEPALYFRPLLQATSLNQVPVRTRIMYSRRTGGPRTVSAVVRRFFRLNNGMWIRTRAGRHKKLWKKNGRRIAALQQHVFCTQRQCWMLDRMVNRYYKIPKFYANDPYAPYHSKKNLPFYNYNKPKFLP